jgi:hypothetical protein
MAKFLLPYNLLDYFVRCDEQCQQSSTTFYFFRRNNYDTSGGLHALNSAEIISI